VTRSDVTDLTQHMERERKRALKCHSKFVHSSRLSNH